MPSSRRGYNRLSPGVIKNIQTERTSAKPLKATQLSPETEAQNFLDFLATQSATNSGEDFPVSSGALATEDVAADISFLGRTLASFGADSPVYQAVGVTTGVNSFMGLCAAWKASRRYQEAVRIGDTQGEVESGVDVARGVTQGIGGSAYLGYRGAMIASAIVNVDTSMAATTALGQATFYVGLVGNLFFSAFYLFFGVWSGFHLYQINKFESEMNKADSAAAFVLAQAHADTHAKLAKLRVFPERHKNYKKSLEKTCLNTFADRLCAWQKEAIAKGKFQGKELSHAEMKEVVKKLFAVIDRNPEAYIEAYREQMGLSEEEIAFLNLTPMQICGLKLSEQHRQARKEARVERVVGSAAMDKIKKAYRKGLDQRLEAPEATAEARELEEAVKAGLFKNTLIHSSVVFFSVLGVITTVATIGLFALPPAAMLAMTILTLALIGVMAGLDIYMWKEGLDSGKPGKHDKLFVGIISAVLLGALIGSAVLTFGLGFPVMPFVFAMVMGAVALGVCSYAFVKLHQREKTWKDENPTLSDFSRTLPERGPLNERAKTQFKKLSKADRRAIRAHYKRVPANFVCEDPDLIKRAAKRASKEYWAKWHHTRQESDKELALAMQTENVDVNDKIFRSNLYYLHSRENHAGKLKETVRRVAKPAHAKNEPSLARVHQIHNSKRPPLN